jgi:hypothetical protein
LSFQLLLADLSNLKFVVSSDFLFLSIVVKRVEMATVWSVSIKLSAESLTSPVETELRYS